MSFNPYSRIKSDLCTIITVLASFILSYALMLLFSILLFELDGIPLAFLVGSYSDDELPHLFLKKTWEGFIFPSFFQVPHFFFFFFATYSALGWQFFPFSTFNISSHCPLACRVPAEKFTDSIIGLLLHMVIYFLVAVRILSVFFF